MADNNRFDIYLHLDGLGGDGGAMADSGESGTKTDTSPSEAVTGKVAKKLQQVVSFSSAAALADRLISYEISQVSLRTGAVEYEQRQQAAYGVGRSVVGAGVSLAYGAIAGGPAGLAVAAIGVAVSGVNKLVGIAQKEQTLRTEQSLENISIGMASVRAGVNGRRSSNQ